MDRDGVLVAALGAAVLTGCTSSSRPTPSPTASPTPPPVDPDVAVLEAWFVAERSLAARYATVVRAVPAVKALSANHVTRAGAVADHLRVRGETAPPVPTAAPLRGGPAAQVAALAKAERSLAATYVRALAGVADQKVAVLGAELAAGARQNAAVLAIVAP